MTYYIFRFTQAGLLLASVAMSLIVCAIAQHVGTAIASAQDNPALIPQTEPVNTQQSLSLYKDFNLNITDQHIIEQDYKASTAINVGEGGARGISLRIGADVHASKVDMRLHNINGQVHFRGNWNRLPLRGVMNYGS